MSFPTLNITRYFIELLLDLINVQFSNKKYANSCNELPIPEDTAELKDSPTNFYEDVMNLYSNPPALLYNVVKFSLYQENGILSFSDIAKLKIRNLLLVPQPRELTKNS